MVVDLRQLFLVSVSILVSHACSLGLGGSASVSTNTLLSRVVSNQSFSHSYCISEWQWI